MTKVHVSSKQKKRGDTTKSKYIKPGALAQICIKKVATRSSLDINKRITTRSCTDITKKRVVLDSKRTELDVSSPSKTPKKVILPFIGCSDAARENKLPRTPRTPQTLDFVSQSRLESLPLDLLVKICCHLHHDQLRAIFHVSRRIREAVLLAIQWHFNYTTPDRSRQEMLRTRTPLPTERWPFRSKGDLASGGPGPRTPKAPRQAPRPSRSRQFDMKQIAAVLFQESILPPNRSKAPPGLPRPNCKPSASNRVLFYEEELCHAVAQNKLQ